jgi:flavodoxin
MSRTLVAYYSMSGNTRALARELGASLGADMEEIVEPRARQGAGGYLRGVFESLTRRSPPIAEPVHDPTKYDVVLMGGPVWAGHIASPVRTFAGRYGAAAKHVGFFCTEGGRGSETAFAELEQLCRHPPDATLVVDAKHLPPDAHQGEVRDFTNRLQTLQ